MKCKYCGYPIDRRGALCSDGKRYHKRCLEIITLREKRLKEEQEKWKEI